MVLSNKKLKQKLRAAKVELLAAAEAQNNANGKDFDKLGSSDSKESHSLKILANAEAKRPKLSKRETQRQRAEKDGEVVKRKQTAGGGAEEKTEGELNPEGEVKKKKRKRDENETKEQVKEKKPEQQLKEKEKKPEQQLKKKKKTKNERKPKNKSENNQVKEQVHKQNGSQATGEQLVAAATDSRKEVEPSTKVYVGGIPYYSTEDDIRSYFESCGTITDVDCMEFPDTGKFRGIAIITFKTEAAAKRALALDGSDMGGLFLKIQPFKSTRVVNKSSNFSPGVVDGYNRIYIGNLSWDVSEDELRKLFSDCTITSIRFGEDKETGEFKGYAHINFADSLSLNMALKLDQTMVCGRHVRISCAVPLKKTDTKLKSTWKENHIDNVKVSSITKNEDITSAKVGAVSKDHEKSSLKVSAHSKDLEKSSFKVSAVSKDPENSSAKVTVVNKDQVSTSVKFPTVITAQENNTEVQASAVSSKIRRRTCYECGEKGHISSLCPKKQSGDSSNPGAA